MFVDFRLCSVDEKKKIGINTALRMIINGWFELSRNVRNVFDHAIL